MPRLLPALFLASAALLRGEVESLARLPAVTFAVDRVLPLDQAIDRALSHNLGLAVNRLDAGNAQDVVTIADAEVEALIAAPPGDIATLARAVTRAGFSIDLSADPTARAERATRDARALHRRPRRLLGGFDLGPESVGRRFGGG